MDLSRRNFMKLGAAGVAAAGLAGLSGCAPTAKKEEQLATTGTTEDWLGSAPALAPEDCSETVETEVLVVGSALAGSMAAYGAMRKGAQVTVIERNASPHIGGMTISFLNSETQLNAGLPQYDPVQTANDMFNLTQYRSDMRLNALWCERSGEVLDNLRKDFLEPYNQYYLPLSLEGIFPDPTQEITSYISTGVAFSETDILTDFTHNIHQFLQDKGVETYYRTKAEVLVQDESGRVTGVVATNENGDNVYFKASKGVIMCTGSFGGNEAMMRRFYPKNFADWAIDNNAYEAYMGDDPVTDNNMDDGLGHRMLCWAGAEMEEICSYAAWQTTAWRSFPYLLVNTKGERFMNECTSLLTSAHIVADQPGDGNYVWQIIPTNNFEMPSSFGYDKQMAAEMFKIEESEHYEADTIAELAELIDVDPDTLVATVERYNELCNNGADTDYMKAKRYLDPIDDGPYQAWKMTYLFYCTLSGVRCNDKLQVLDANHDPIPGLYAGGNTVGYRFGASYESLLHGGSNGLATTHAYLAGENAALS
ncbi:FAD-dependent oxidoreductase [Eggerthellaceae bacterium 24-137]